MHLTQAMIKKKVKKKECGYRNPDIVQFVRKITKKVSGC